jgi:hypothetical protein
MVNKYSKSHNWKVEEVALEPGYQGPLAKVLSFSFYLIFNLIE